MSREGGLLGLAAVLLALLAAITAAQPPARELTTLVAPTSVAAGMGGEGLADAVRYAELRVHHRGTVRVGVDGTHGGVLLSLVDGDDRVREVRLDAGETVARFGAVEAGRYAIRALAAPPDPPARSGAVTVRVTTGGRPWALFGAAALLVAAPPLVLRWRRRRARRDGEAGTR